MAGQRSFLTPVLLIPSGRFVRRHSAMIDFAIHALADVRNLATRLSRSLPAILAGGVGRAVQIITRWATAHPVFAADIRHLRFPIQPASAVDRNDS